MNFFKSPIDIEIHLDGEETRKKVDIENPSQRAKTLRDSYPLYKDGESVSGSVTIRVKDGKRLEHLGIKVQLLGTIDTTINDGDTSKKGGVEDFLCLGADLSVAGELTHSETYDFNFKDVEKRYESYRGKNVTVTYSVKVTVLRKSSDIVRAKNFWVWLYSEFPPESKPVKLDIGIENCLHIEFEFGKNTFTLKDVLMGRIYFLLTRLKIKHMEISLLTRESSGLGPNQMSDSTAIRYEIMDGSPAKGETIPIRLFLGGYDLVPTVKSNLFSVKNYLSLVIIDEDGRRYFKQTEVVLYRAK